jgi:formate hydrogenlyase subunit 5
VTHRYVELDELVDVCSELKHDGWRLATIAVADSEAPELRYVFCGPRGEGWRQAIVRPKTPGIRSFPSLTPSNVAADWLEREIEDLFAINFTGHPRLGDFVLHDDLWAEGIGPMRPGVALREGRAERPWQPRRALREEGAFVMPVGPVYSGEAESALFLLETVGEDVVRAVPRLFYKYRGVEKLAQGRKLEDALLLVERANGTSAFAHGWTYCMAAERILGVEIPSRAQYLRTMLAEIERVRRHTAVVRAIADSTSLWVAAARLLELEERLLRACGAMTGHRYLFGLMAIGGLQRDVDAAAIAAGVRDISAAAAGVLRTVEELADTSSFLDRIERVGILARERALEFGAVGPFARASAAVYDLRREQPYGAYEASDFEVASAEQGDGYARLRVLAAEVATSLRIVGQLARTLPSGAIRTAWSPRTGEALGWAESPGGASLQLLGIDERGTCVRLRFTPPSFRNWQCFRLVAEDFAFQDFPIILATCGLSVAENDR